jgi:hypothetical protein
MTGIAPAGWYPDPSGSGQQRYWTGQQWTEHTSAVADGSPSGNSFAAKPEKSVALGVVLTVLFGPFAYFYVGAAYGFFAIALTIVVAVIAVFTFGIPLLGFWVVLTVGIVHLINQYNTELREVHSSSAVATTPIPASIGQSTSNQTLCTVHVVGAVFNPGLYHLPHGSRVYDAVSAAGGARPQANLTTLNVARVIADGEQIVVP